MEKKVPSGDLGGRGYRLIGFDRSTQYWILNILNVEFWMLNLSSMEKTKSQTCVRQAGHKSPFTTHYRLPTTDYQLKTTT